jgi:microcin C transport system permease protein
MVPTFLGITFVAFLITQFVPGGPIDQLKAQMLFGNGGESGVKSSISNTSSNKSRISEEDMKVMREFYGFDKPWYVQYYNWIKKYLFLI